MLGSERKLELPEEHMPPRLRRKLPSIKISAEGREQRSESYIFYSSTCDMYSSSSCDGATRTCVVYSRTCDMYNSSSSSSSCDEAALHVLSTLLRTVCTAYSIYAAAAVVSPFYAATLWVIASPHTYSHSLHKQTGQQHYHSIVVAGNYPAFCGTRITTRAHPPQHLLAPSSTC